jgi:hypothetical protein
MINKKYNPMSKKNNKSKKTNYKFNKNKLTNILLYLTIGIVICSLIWYYYNKYYNSNNILKDSEILNENNTTSKDKLIKKEFDVDLVPSGDKIVEGFENSENTTYDAKIISDPDTEQQFYGLTPSDQTKLCMNKVDMVVGYRNFISGATFRFQKVDPTDSDDNANYFLLGSINNGQVIQVDEKDNLEFKTKSSSENKQFFKRKTSDEGQTYYFVPYSDDKKALQYEFEHLSLRPIRTNEPYEGQKFIKMNYTSPDEINKLAVSYGIGTPHIDQDDIKNNGNVTYVMLNNGSNMTGSSDNVTSKINTAVQQSQQSNNDLKDAVNKVVEAVNNYNLSQEQINKNQSNSPLNISLNLFDGDKTQSSSFTDISDKEAFNNLRGSNSIYGNEKFTDVRSLLNQYSSISNNNDNLTGISRLSDTLNKNYNNKLNAASGMSFRECPTVDYSKYITKRQASRCYGCNPDSSLQ